MYGILDIRVWIRVINKMHRYYSPVRVEADQKQIIINQLQS
jgi:hypothetical protein